MRKMFNRQQVEIYKNSYCAVSIVVVKHHSMKLDNISITHTMYSSRSLKLTFLLGSFKKETFS